MPCGPGGGRHPHPHRCHHREPLLRGQRAPAEPLDPLSPGVFDARRAPPRDGTGLAAEGATTPSAIHHLVNRSTATPARPSTPSRWRWPSRRDAGRHPGRRRGRPRRPSPALRSRRSLRRHLGLHQVDPGLGSRRRALLAGPHAGGGGGRPLHRPPAGDPGQRGHRHGRPDGAAGGRLRGPGGGVRGPARSPAQPGPGRGAPGHRPQVQPGLRGPGAARPTSHRPAGRSLHLRSTAPNSAAARGRRGYHYPHDDPRGWVPQTTVPPRWRAGATTNHPVTAERSRRADEAIDPGETEEAATETVASRWRPSRRDCPVIVAVVFVLVLYAATAPWPPFEARRDVHREVLPLLAEHWRCSITDLDRVDACSPPASITGTVDSASRLAYLAFGNPVVKTMAAGSGVTRAWRRSRKKLSGRGGPRRR